MIKHMAAKFYSTAYFLKFPTVCKSCRKEEFHINIFVTEAGDNLTTLECNYCFTPHDIEKTLKPTKGG